MENTRGKMAHKPKVLLIDYCCIRMILSLDTQKSGDAMYVPVAPVVWWLPKIW